MTPPIRILPHNLSAEASVLGGVLLRRAALDEPAVAALEVPDFYGPKHQAVWMAMRNLEATSQPIDPITVEVELQRLGKLDAVGGLAFLGELALVTPTAERTADYAAIVGKLSTRRKVIQACADVLDRLYAADQDDDLDLVADAHAAELLDLLVAKGPVVLHRREADAAIAHHHRGDAVAGTGTQLAAPGRLAVIVGVNVDYPRQYPLPGRIDLALAAGTAVGLDPDHSALVNQHVGLACWRAGTVEQQAIADQQFNIHDDHPWRTPALAID